MIRRSITEQKGVSGIGLVAHGLSVFGLGGFLGSEWEERKIKEIVDKQRSR
jgi:hypothetical protein